jgi:hypothetical protein
MLIQVREASKTPNRLDPNITNPQHIIIETSTEYRAEYTERILKAAREKEQVT